MKKEIVKILMCTVLASTLLGACSTNRSTQDEQKASNTEISNIVKNDTESIYEKNTEKNTEEVVKKTAEDYLYLTTDYKVEDYCNGYFIVSKMDRRLFGVINSKGKEVIPLKYDEVSFYNRQEVLQQGVDTLLFHVAYQDEEYLLDTNGEEYNSVIEIKPLLGDADDNIKYYSRPLDMYYVDKEYTNGDIEYAMGNGKIIFYDKGKNEIGSFSAGEEDSIKEYYQLTKDYYLIYTNDDYIYINNKDNSTIWEEHKTDLKVEKINNQILISYGIIGNWNTTYIFGTDGTMTETNGFYTDYTGIHKGNEEGKIYTLGKNDNIILKRYDDTWLLEGDNEKLCNDRYFAMDPICAYDLNYEYGYFFLLNSNSKVILIDKDANIIDTNDLFTLNDGESPYFNGVNIFDDTVISGTDALYIARQNGDKYDIYRFAAKK